MYNSDYGDVAWPVSTTPSYTETAGGMHLREESPRCPPRLPPPGGHPCAWASRLGILKLETRCLELAQVLRPMQNRPQPQTVLPQAALPGPVIWGPSPRHSHTLKLLGC